MGQALFLGVFVALLAVATVWAADDLRVRGEVSELAELVLRLMAVLGAGVFLLTLSASTWALELPTLLRVPAGAASAVTGLLVVLTAGRACGHRLRLLRANPVLAGFLLIGAGAALVSDSGVALLLVAVTALVVAVLTAAAVRGAASPRTPAPRGARWTSHGSSSDTADAH